MPLEKPFYLESHYRGSAPARDSHTHVWDTAARFPLPTNRCALEDSGRVKGACREGVFAKG